MTKKEVLEAAARGEGCLGRSADDEPVFVICARDITSTEAVLGWMQLAGGLGAGAEKLLDAARVAIAMTAWRNTRGRGGKVPD